MLTVCLSICAVRLPTGAAKLVPDEPEPFIILGVLCVIKGQYEDAIGHMKAALENDPTDYTLWNKLGAVQTHSSQVRALLSRLRRCLTHRHGSSLSSANPLLSVSVSVCVRVCVLCVFLSVSLPSLSHQREQAATAYKRALKIRPAYNRAVENLRRLEPQAAGQ